MKPIRIHPQFTVNPQLLHVDILSRHTLDVGRAPEQTPKYSALFVAHFVRHQYKEVAPLMFLEVAVKLAVLTLKLDR